MITKTSTIDNIGFDLDGRGDIAVRIAKCTYDGDQLLARENHRFLLQAGDDIDAQMVAVNADLLRMGFAPVPEDDVAHLKADAKRRWTPERKAARKERDKVAKEQMEAVSSDQPTT